MPSSLLLLLDDVASVLDDVATMTKIAAKKTAGVLGDDLALNAKQVAGVLPDRELAVVWRVARGSAVNKLMLVPAALALSWLAPWAVTPLLMAGGAYLCYEGAEKILARLGHGAHSRAASRLANPGPGPVVGDAAASEAARVAGAVRTDFILSAEIIVITLGVVAGRPLVTQLVVLVAISAAMTVGVYGLVAAIVKLDDAGIVLANRPEPALAWIGRGILSAAPWLMRGLSVAGTAAMFLVGGGIVAHGIPMVQRLVHDLPGPLAPAADAVVGLLLGIGLVGAKAASRGWVVSLVLLLAALNGLRSEAAFDVSPPRPVGKGTAVVLRQTGLRGGRSGAASGDLLIHFHGAVDTIREALERAGTEATVVLVNQPGLSAAYAAPFREDPRLFDTLLAEPLRSEAGAGDAPAPPWRRVTLSCFSAGYGAVREMLKDPAAFDRIDAIVAADSIYAGLEDAAASAGGRRVAARDMSSFVAFAAAAARGEKVFVVTHSAQPTPYASTTETADCLLDELGLGRTAVAPPADEEFPQVSQAGRRGFLVMGFAGASGPAHLFHLRFVDRWWEAARRVDEADGRDEVRR